MKPSETTKNVTNMNKKDSFFVSLKQTNENVTSYIVTLVKRLTKRKEKIFHAETLYFQT